MGGEDKIRTVRVTLGFGSLLALLFPFVFVGEIAGTSFPVNQLPGDGRIRGGIPWHTERAHAAPGPDSYSLFLPLVARNSWSGPYDDRFGVVGTGFPGPGALSLLDSLHVRQYYQYSWGEPLPGKERLQLVGRSSISDVGLDDFIRAHPGQYWQVGNEPNVPNQDALTPTEFAQQYHTWYTRIKAIDPTARILNAGIVNWPDVMGVDGAGVAYLRDFREAYLTLYGTYPPVDIWNIHDFPPFYVGSDGRLHTNVCGDSGANALYLVKRFISQASSYLRGAGEKQPIWLTEFGADYADDNDPCVVTFMRDWVNWLEQTGLVARWYWFSTNATADGKGGSLVDLSGNLTPLGRAYRDLALGGN